MAPPYTGLEDKDNFLDKVEAQIDIHPFDMDSPWETLEYLGQAYLEFVQVQKMVVKEEHSFPLAHEDQNLPPQVWAENANAPSWGITRRIEIA